MTTLYIILSFAGGCLFYAKLLDKAEVRNVFKKFKQKKTNGSNQIINNENPKTFARINSGMSRREVVKLWKSIKNL